MLAPAIFGGLWLAQGPVCPPASPSPTNGGATAKRGGQNKIRASGWGFTPKGPATYPFALVSADRHADTKSMLSLQDMQIQALLQRVAALEREVVQLRGNGL